MLPFGRADRIGRCWAGFPVEVPGEVTGGQVLSAALGVSADGSVIVGSANGANSRSHAFRWDAAHGMVDLGSMLKEESSVAVGVSADGNSIIGWDKGDSSVSAWVGNGQRGVVFLGGAERLIHPYGWAGMAQATNDVGSTIVGQTHPANAATTRGGGTTWRWSAWKACWRISALSGRVFPARISKNTNPRLRRSAARTR